MKRKLIPFVLAIAGLAGVVSATPVSAHRRPLVELTGTGTYVIDADQRPIVSGTISGRPFGGTFVASVTIRDRTLPPPGVCNDDVAVYLTVDGPRRKETVFLALGEICGVDVQLPTSVVSHVFTGTYDVVESSNRRIVSTDGFLEVRLGVNGSASVTAIDT